MEHLATFGLPRDPFANDPDLALFYDAASCSDATRRLRRAAMQSKGLCVVTGRSGVGKTMLVRHLLESLDSEMFEGGMLVPVPGVSDLGWILNRLARQLGVEEPARERADVLAEVYEQLCIVREDGRHAVLIVDEAQVLAEAGWLGELRGLLNLEYEDRRLLTLVLVGLPSLATALHAEPALADRVDVQLKLAALTADEAPQYLKHRIRCVGGNPAILESGALSALVKCGEGLPRRLNTIADDALFAAHLAGRVSATADDVERVVSELGLETSPPSAPAAGTALPTAVPASAPPRAAESAQGPLRDLPFASEIELSDEIELAEEVEATSTDPRVRHPAAGANGPSLSEAKPPADQSSRRPAADLTTAFFADAPAPARRSAPDVTQLFEDGLEPASGGGGFGTFEDTGGELDDLFADLVDD